MGRVRYAAVHYTDPGIRDLPDPEEQEAGLQDLEKESVVVRAVLGVPPPVTDYRVYRLSAQERLFYGAQGAAAALAVSYIFYRSLVIFLILAPAAVIYPEYKKKELLQRRKRKLEHEFREGIMTLSSALSAGYSPENAMREAERELRMMYSDRSMIVQEFELINTAVTTNVPLEKAWESFALRSGSEDIVNFAEVIRTAKRSDGDLTEIIAHTAETISDKMQIMEEIATMTSGKRFEQKIMNLIPLLIVVYIDTTSPGFFDPMYRSLAGRVVMTGCLACYIAALLLSEKLLQVEI